MAETTFDFGAGPVPAHRHLNPDGSVGGWVADTAKVADTAFVGPAARVFDIALVLGHARVSGRAQVSGNGRRSGRQARRPALPENADSQRAGNTRRQAV